MRFEFRFPDLGEGLVEAEIVKWHVKPGDYVKEGQVILEVQTAKANVEIPSPVSGVVVELRFKEGDVVRVGDVLLVIETEAPSGGGPSEARAQPSEIKAMPAARKLAKELGIDLALVKGTGPGGVITVDDVRRFAEASRSEAAIKPVEKPPEEVVPVRGIRRVIAEKMTKSKRNIPHAYHIDEIDMTEIVSIRERLKPIAEAKGVRLTYLPFIVKAVSMALKEYPLLNSTFNEEKNEIIIKRQVNMGIAVDTEQGLVVVVVRDTDNKSILEIAREASGLAEKARSGKLSLNEVTGSTFSITNIGAIGGLGGLGIINYPEGTVMALGRITKKPVVNEKDEVVIRRMMMTTVSFDHRITDGAYVARFMNRVKELLEKPYTMLLELR